MENTKQDILKWLYFDVNSVGSLRGPQALYKQALAEGHRHITHKDCRDFLRAIPTYTLYRPARKNFPRNVIRAEEVGEILQIDICFLKQYKKDNDDFAYVLIATDTFSKYTLLVPLQNRTPGAIIEALKEVFQSGVKPTKIYWDREGAFVSKEVQNFLKTAKVSNYSTKSKVKAPQAERFIRTLRNAIMRYFRGNNTRRWLEYVGTFIQNYNNRVHCTHRQKPADVLGDPERNWAAWQAMYGQRLARKPCSNGPKVGDYVRLSRLKQIFEKESSELGTFTEEVFRVDAVDRSQKWPMYQLNDLAGDAVEGKAYAEEIQVVHFDENSAFVIDRVKKRRHVNGVLQYFVSWRGWPPKFDSWINATDVQDVL